MEEREEGAVAKAKSLLYTWRVAFFRMDFSIHPKDLPGEAPGKSSNVSWAVKQYRIKYPTMAWKGEVIITVMDGKFPKTPFRRSDRL